MLTADEKGNASLPANSVPKSKIEFRIQIPKNVKPTVKPVKTAREDLFLNTKALYTGKISEGIKGFKI